MPSFTTEIANLEDVGPLVDMSVLVSLAAETALKVGGTPIPAPVPVTAMVDTGASLSVVQQGIPAKLGLKPVGRVNIRTPSSTGHPCFMYSLRFVFPYNISLEVAAIEAPLQGQHIQALIGRDVLAQGTRIYIGFDNRFCLSF